MKSTSSGVIINGAATIVATTAYTGIDVEHTQPREIQAVWTATTVSGTISVQVSLDGTTWEDTETPIAVTASGSNIWLINRHATYMRIYYVRTSGTITTLSAYVSSIGY